MASVARGSGMTPGQLVAAFRRSMAADLVQVRRATHSGDFALVARLAHGITGACLMLGAGDLTRACGLLAAAADAASGMRVEAALAVFERGLAALEASP